MIDAMTTEEIQDIIDGAIQALQAKRPTKKYLLVSPSHYRKLLDVAEAAKALVQKPGDEIPEHEQVVIGSRTAYDAMVRVLAALEEK